MNFKKSLKDGLLTNNPVLGQLLGMDADSMRSMVSRARKRAKKLLEEMNKEER